MKTYKPVKDFMPGVRIAFSSAEDGSMAAGGGHADQPVHQHAVRRFLQTYFDTADTTKVLVTYTSDNTYTHIERVTSRTTLQPIKADALFTTERGRVITLSVADCVATVVYDPVAVMLGVLHLGRHASVAGLIEAFAIRVADEMGSDPRDWHVWMSPSLQQASNALDYFEPPYPSQWQPYMRSNVDGRIHIDIPGHNRERFERLGVQPAHISVSPINTYTDERYFSHRAATEGNQPKRQGRMVVAAAMTD